MKNKKYKIGEVVDFGVIKAKVCKRNFKSNCYNCVFYRLCEMAIETDMVDELEKFTGPCITVDKRGNVDSIYFKEVIETEENGSSKNL